MLRKLIDLETPPSSSSFYLCFVFLSVTVLHICNLKFEVNCNYSVYFKTIAIALWLSSPGSQIEMCLLALSISSRTSAHGVLCTHCSICILCAEQAP